MKKPMRNDAVIRCVFSSALRVLPLSLGMAGCSGSPGDDHAAPSDETSTSSASVSQGTTTLTETVKRPGNSNVVTIWRNGDAVAHVDGPPGTTVDLIPVVLADGHAGLTFRARIPRADLASLGSGETQRRRVYDAARGAGFSPEEAESIAGTLPASADDGPRVAEDALPSSDDTSSGDDTSSVDDTSAAAGPPNGSIIGSVCAQINNAKWWARACDVMKMVQNNGHDDWYIGDQISASAYGLESSHELSGVSAYQVRAANAGVANSDNDLVEWEPTNTQYAEACKSWSVGLEAFGFGVTAGSTFCPSTISPIIANEAFGSLWRSTSSTASRMPTRKSGSTCP
jgi:hypothetical protein